MSSTDINKHKKTLSQASPKRTNIIINLLKWLHKKQEAERPNHELNLKLMLRVRDKLYHKMAHKESYKIFKTSNLLSF